MDKIRLILIGGFLGAGKTTSVLELGKQLQASGKKVGIITNDQGSSLVDGKLIDASGFTGVEITGGCFCCKFNAFSGGMDKLIDGSRPDVIIAEPVGSCTDLITTVFFPLQANYPGRISLSPFSVVADGEILSGIATGNKFNFAPEIKYLYEKQLEEANIIPVNKTDLLSKSQIHNINTFLKKKYPAKSIIPVCASTGQGFDLWLKELMPVQAQYFPLSQIDYELYGKAESMLGWYNSSIRFKGTDVFDPNDISGELLTLVSSRVKSTGSNVAHLKIIAKCSGGLIKASITNNTETPHFSIMGYDFTKEIDIIINARVEIEAPQLKGAVDAAIACLAEKYNLSVRFEHEECFKPLYPTPSYPREASSNAGNIKGNS